TVSGNDTPFKLRGGANGIRVGETGVTTIAQNDTIEANVAFVNEDSGIEIRGDQILSRYNQSWKNQDHGYDHDPSNNVKHIGDLAWGNARDGMSFETNSSNNTVRNCVIANNGGDRGRRDYEIETFTGSRIGWTSDYNVIWRSTQAEPADSILISWWN